MSVSPSQMRRELHGSGVSHCCGKSEIEPGRGHLCIARAWHGMSEPKWVHEDIHGGQINLAKNNTRRFYAPFTSPSPKLNILHNYTTIWKPIKQHWYHWYHSQSLFRFHKIHVYPCVYYVCVILCNFVACVALYNYNYNQYTQLFYHHEAILRYHFTATLISRSLSQSLTPGNH